VLFHKLPKKRIFNGSKVDFLAGGGGGGKRGRDESFGFGNEREGGGGGCKLGEG
jgi:hypothetical protein